MNAEVERAPAREPFFYTGAVFFAVITLGVSAAYLVQVVTPLRLDDDALDYLRMAAAITDGQHLPTLPIPVGYSAMISLLERAGLGTSAFFVLANCLFLALGLWSVWQLRGYQTRAKQVAVLATLLAIPVVKSALMPLPEAAFFGVSLIALWAMSSVAETEGGDRLVRLTLSVAAAFIAISLRYAGIALVAPLAVCVLHAFPRDSTISGKRTRLIVEVAAIVLLVSVLSVVTVTSRVFSMYVAQAHEFYSAAPLSNRLLNRALVIVRSAGEIFLNVPYSRFRASESLFVTAGAIVSAVGLALVRMPARRAVESTYLIAYLLLLIAWPNPAPRLWIPIIPLLFAELTEGFMRLPRARWLLVAAATYLAWFGLTGFAALAYSTRISLSGERFPQLYGKNGGLGDPDIKQGDPSWPRVQLYNAEARRMLARYGR